MLRTKNDLQLKIIDNIFIAYEKLPINFGFGLIQQNINNFDRDRPIEFNLKDSKFELGDNFITIMNDTEKKYKTLTLIPH